MKHFTKYFDLLIFEMLSSHISTEYMDYDIV